MLFNAKNASVSIGACIMDYISFGSGEESLIILPGLGDGLRSVRGTALPMAIMYSAFAKKYRVYAFSRKRPLEKGASTADMAADLKSAMDALGIEKAHVLGVSMGGMIAQHLAADYPERVDKLVLTVTCPKANPILEAAVGEWLSLAKKGDHAAFMDSNLRLIYSDAYYRKNKWLAPVVGMLTKPKSYENFFIQAEACLSHDAAGKLGSIKAPTLVIGGEKDKALGGDASRELADAIPGAALKMYPQWGHGLYEEEKGFNALVLDFLRRK